MTVWTFIQRAEVEHDVDALPIQLHQLGTMTIAEIERMRVGQYPLGDLFRVSSRTTAGDVDRIVMEGDFKRFHHIAAGHRQGEFIVEGSVGNMLGGPAGNCQMGMQGGRVDVRGDAGNNAGHRMRRGILVVGGNVGRLVASHMIAGTLVVGGTVGEKAAYAMRRGTLIVSTSLDLKSPRFSPPNQTFTPFWAVFCKSVLPHLVAGSAAAELVRQLESGYVETRRGDRAVGGQGEIVRPLAAKDRFPGPEELATLHA